MLEFGGRQNISAKPSAKIFVQLAVRQHASRQRDVPIVHVTDDPTALVAPMPEVVRQICAEDAVCQIVQDFVTDSG